MSNNNNVIVIIGLIITLSILIALFFIIRELKNRYLKARINKEGNNLNDIVGIKNSQSNNKKTIISMEQKQLLVNEEIIFKSKSGFLTLTTHRVRTNKSRSSSNNIVSIMLEKISSIEAVSINLWVFLIMGIISVCIGVLLSTQRGSNGASTGFLLIIGIIFIFVFFVTRKSSIVISSDGGSKIYIESSGMGMDSIIEFIDKIENAKNNRFILLNK